eukprot:2498863-Alexandrium_andersonii.AAC.1
MQDPLRQRAKKTQGSQRVNGVEAKMCGSFASGQAGRPYVPALQGPSQARAAAVITLAAVCRE